MSPNDRRRILLVLSNQLRAGEELTDDQRSYLSSALYRIGNGEDANRVFDLALTRGETNAKFIARQRMSLILHWVAGAVAPDPTSTQKTLTLAQACEQAMTTIVPRAKAMFPGADDKQYDADYIQRCWSDPLYAHMRSTERGLYDSDFPYYEPHDVKDPK